MLTFLGFAVWTLIFWFILDKVKHAKYPAGPLRLPIVGNLIQISRASSYPAVAFQKLAKIYGDIFYLRMGFTDTIVFNSYESIRDIRSHELCLDISQDMIPVVWERMDRRNLGLIWCNGNEWQALRRFSIRTLRDFGFGKTSSMDVVINEEVDKFTKHIKEEMKKNSDGVNDTLDILSLSIVNILWRLVTGVTYELNDKEMIRLLQLNNDSLKSSNFAMDISIAYPFLFDWFPTWMRKEELNGMMNNLKDFLKNTVEQHRALGVYKTNPNCYVDVFLSKIEESENKEESKDIYTYDQLIMCLLDMFQAGADTTSNTLTFSLLYMLMHPNVQEKVQREIDENVGPNETITLSMKDKLPYTYATMLESQRYSTVVPVPVAQKAADDFYYKGHLIKKGIILTSNTYGVHFDDDLWGDPHNFRPERFLTEDGALDLKIASNLILFGYGPRICIGATLAESSLFIYLATILKDFNLVKAPDSPDLCIEPHLGMTYSPKPFKCMYVPRK